jgi:L-arabinose isomerase
MWINGLTQLQKPFCHFATQYHVEIPNDEIDMDFMNLNQALMATVNMASSVPECALHRKVNCGPLEGPGGHCRIG